MLGTVAPSAGNFISAVFNAVSSSYGYLSPELWKPTVFSKKRT